MIRFLLVLAALLGAASAQSSPWVRLDLVFVRIDIGGANSGLSLMTPRVGVAIGEVIGAGVGIGPEPAAPNPFESFIALENELSAILQQMHNLIQLGGQAAQLVALQTRAIEIAARKSGLTANM